MTKETLVARAMWFATQAHDGQIRKYTGDPYITHPTRVAHTVAALPDVTDEMIATAWLHDVVEDTDVTIYDILENFGWTVARYVEWLTDTNITGNRAYRKACYANQLANAPRDVLTIKLADLIDNTSDIVKHDPKFARVYLAEKRELLEVLKYGDHGLWVRARKQLKAGEELLELTNKPMVVDGIHLVTGERIHLYDDTKPTGETR